MTAYLVRRSVEGFSVLAVASFLIYSILVLALPGLVQGATITEAVFAYAGMGRLYLEAVTGLDIPLAMAFLMIVTALVVASNMLADMLYALVDPRIRFS